MKYRPDIVPYVINGNPHFLNVYNLYRHLDRASDL